MERDLFLSNENTNKFLLSFDIDEGLYNKDFREEFKQDMQVIVNKDKIKHYFNKQPQVNKLTYLQSIDSINISPNVLKLPVIDDIQNIPPVMYWYKGDSQNKPGIYTCICPGFYANIPFPNLVSVNEQNYKVNSIACRYITKQNCIEHKRKNSAIYNSEVRQCTYVHKKEKFVKIGSNYRCNIESFGNHERLLQDLDIVDNNDIKHILMYSLSDTLLSMIWYQNKFKSGNLILQNLDMY